MLYLPSKEVLERWRDLSKPYKLSHWVVLMVEKGLEDKPDTTTETTDTINVLRDERQELFQQVTQLSQENKILTARLRAKDTAFHDLNAGIVNLFRYGGKEYYTPKDIKDAAALRASSTAGGDGVVKYKMHALRHTSDPELQQEILKSADYTLAQLEAVGLVKKTWKGWQWVL